MPTWLSLTIIVLVAVALFGDLRRNDDPLDGLAAYQDSGLEHEHDRPSVTPKLRIHPNVRDVGDHIRPVGVRHIRGIPVRKGMRNAAKYN